MLPFLSLHLKSTGLSTDDIRIISYVSLLFATLGPITIGPVVDYVSGRRKSEISKSSTKRDKNLYIRTILSLTVLLSAVFYCLLLSVPTVENINFREPEASFVCDDRGASLVQEKCNALNCFQYPKAEMATLENCRFNCNLPAHFSYLEKAHDVEDADMEPVPITTTTVSVPTTISTPEIERTILPLKKSKPETDISNLDTFFGSDHGDDYDDGDAGSGEDPEYNWVIVSINISTDARCG